MMKQTWTRLLIRLVAGLGVAVAQGASATFTGVYSQNFDALGTSSTTMPAGFRALTMGSANTDYTAPSPISTTNIATATATGMSATLIAWNAGAANTKSGTQLYNIGCWDTLNNRALGTDPTGDGAIVIELSLSNNTGGNLSGINLSYVCKCLTNGTPSSGTDGTEKSELPGYAFFYSLTGSSSAADWVKVAALANGNYTQGTTSNSGPVTITFAAPLTNNGVMYFRWADDNNVTNSPDQMLAIDNIGITGITSGFTAYNDCVYSGSNNGNNDDLNTAANVTRYSIGTGAVGPASGPLTNLTDGAGTPVVVTLVGNPSGTNPSFSTGGGTNCFAGTDASVIFTGKAGLRGSQGLSATDPTASVDLIFTNLNPSRMYSFATTANRGVTNAWGGTASPSASNRWTKFTLFGGVTNCANASSAGVNVITNTPTNSAVSFCTAENTVNGYVARWTGIRCDASGSFRVRAENEGLGSHATVAGYGFSAFMLQETPLDQGAPTVSLTSPASGASFTAPAGIPLAATASETGGTVTNVTFYQGTTLLANVAATPYNFTWTGAAAGSYSLTAVAADNRGVAATSSVVSVTVTNPLVAAFTGTYSQTFDQALTNSATAMPAGFQAMGLAGDHFLYTNGAPITCVGVATATVGVASLTVWDAGSAVAKGASILFNVGCWDSLNNRALGTDPTGNAGTVIQLALKNNTGGALNGVTFSYTELCLANGSTSNGVYTDDGTERLELPGYSFFYSLVGDANPANWFEVNALCLTNWVQGTSSDSGPVAITFPAPLTNNSVMYFRWADDNCIASSPDQMYAIDNINITALSGMGPSVSIIAPTNNAPGVPTAPTLDVTVADPEGSAVTVNFYGRAAMSAAASNFTLVALPDTQFYSANMNGATVDTFVAQTAWIVSNRVARNIAYVAHEGDIVQDNDTYQWEWQNATTAMYRLEDPVATGLPSGIPYGICPGNHDQPGVFYNQYFGTNHFAGRSYYGGNYGANNNNHYSFFSANGYDFIVVDLEYNAATLDAGLLGWANSILQTYANRRAIVVTHNNIGTGNPGAFSPAGQSVYDALKTNANFFLTLGGHVNPNGQGQRQDTFNGNTVYSLMADYQDWANGGSGYLRVMTFQPSNSTMQVQTYSPTLNTWLTDATNQFALGYNLQTNAPFALLASVTVPSGSHATTVWSNLAFGASCQWYVTASDGTNVTVGATNGFSTASGVGTLSVAFTSPTNGASAGTNVVFAVLATDSGGAVTSVAFYADGILLGNDTAAPYNWTWNNPAIGSHALTAVASDNMGLVSTSAAVTVTVSSSQTATHPFVGVTRTARTDTSLRPLRMNIVNIDLTAPGLSFKLTPHSGRLDTITEPTLQYLTEQHAQLAFNANFFTPWPMTNADNAADLVGIAASMGNVYSPFEGNPPTPQAIHTNAPGLNIDAANHASIVPRNLSDPSGLTVAEAVTLWNTVSGSEQIVSNGVVVAANSDWNNTLNPRTVIGLAPNNHLIVVVIDGRQPGVSEGMTVGEAAAMLVNDYGVTDALNLDGGGSSTLAMVLTNTAQIVNVPSDNPARSVGSSLAVFATPLAVALTNPAAGTIFMSPANLALGASVQTSVGNATNVAFYNGSSLIGSTVAAPYALAWNGVTSGTYRLTAVAADNAGNVATSAAVNVTVTQPPTVTIISPTNATTVSSNFTIQANAMAVGTVTNVAFYADGNLLGNDTSAPYSWTWNGVTVGSHALTAVAWDNNGLAGTSAVVTVKVAGSFAVWKFGVISDTQWTTGSDDGKNPNTVAANIIMQVNSQFIAQGVKLVVAVGDTMDSSSQVSMDTRALFAQDLYNAGIGFYPIRGNHDSGWTGSAAEEARVYPQIVHGGTNNMTPSDVLASGYGHDTSITNAAPSGAPFVVGTNFSYPSSVNSANGSLSYSLDFNNTRFVLIDQFENSDPGGTTTSVAQQQPWIAQQLADAARPQHAFVFDH